VIENTCWSHEFLVIVIGELAGVEPICTDIHDVLLEVGNDDPLALLEE